MTHENSNQQWFPIRFFLCLAIVLLALTLMPDANAKAGGVSDKLNYIKTVYPTGSHFTTTGQACYNNVCSKCSLNNIPARCNLSSGAAAANTMGNAWSCTGFAKYVFYNVFGVRHSNSNNAVYYSLSNAQIGDYVQMWNTSSYGYNTDYITHCAIFMGWQGSTPIWYESNYSVCNQVYYSAYNQKRALYRIYHAYNYDTINNASYDTQAPVFDTNSISIKNVSWQGYDVSIKVSDNVGVTQVRFPAWTPDNAVNGNNQDDLVWHEGSKGSDGVTWSAHVSSSQHKNETGCRYWTDIYAYDASGNKTVFSKVCNGYARADVPIHDTTGPSISSLNYEKCTWEGFSLTCKVTDNVSVSRVTYRITAGSTTKTLNASITDGWASLGVKTSEFSNQWGLTYSVTATAYDPSGNTGTATLSVPVPAKDTQKPTVANVRIEDPTPQGYTLICDVSDNDRVDRAELRTYSVANGSDDAVTKTITAFKPASSSGSLVIYPSVNYTGGFIKAGVLGFRVTSHDYETGLYVTEITVYDAEGNYTHVNAYCDLPPYPNPPVVTGCTTMGNGTDLYETTITFEDDNTVNFIRASISCTNGESFQVTCSPVRKDGKLQLSWLLPAGEYKMSATAYSPYEKWYDPLSTLPPAIGGLNNLSASADAYYFTVSAGSTPGIGTRVASVESDHKIYALYQFGGTWAAAKRAAEQQSGCLAILDNAIRQSSAEALMKSAGFNAWIGGIMKMDYHGSLALAPYYAWLDGSRFSYTNWNPECGQTSEGIEYCVQMDPDGGWNGVINSAVNTGGYIAQFEPVSMSVSSNTSVFALGSEFDANALTVNITFADGTRLTAQNYDIELPTEPGAQTVTVSYGDLSQSIDVMVYKPMDTPDMTMPANLKTIDEEAMASTHVSVIMCSDGLESIGQRAFANCQELRQIYIPGSIKSIANNAFEGCTDVSIWGVSGTVAEYYAAAHGFTFYELYK